MAALTKERMTREERWTYRLFKLAAGKRAFKGGTAAYDEAAAAAIPANGQNDLFPLGLFYETVDNTAGTAPLDVNVRLFREVTVWWFANDVGAGAIAATDIGKPCNLLDDQTVTIAAGGSVFGTIWAVDPIKGVAVEVK